jgi:hypothetical protein
MECSAAVRNTFLSIVLLLGLFALPGVSYADHSMVLVTSSDSPVDSVSPLDIRKLYLGFVVRDRQGNPIRPMTNASDSRLWEIFLQDVMGMSARSYDRRLLTLTLQSGRPRPDVYGSLQSILDSVEQDDNAVAIVWEEDIAKRPGLKVIRVLWHR